MPAPHLATCQAISAPRPRKKRAKHDSRLITKIPVQLQSVLFPRIASQNYLTPLDHVWHPPTPLPPVVDRPLVAQKASKMKKPQLKCQKLLPILLPAQVPHPKTGNKNSKPETATAWSAVQLQPQECQTYQSWHSPVRRKRHRRFVASCCCPIGQRGRAG